MSGINRSLLCWYSQRSGDEDIFLRYLSSRISTKEKQFPFLDVKGPYIQGSQSRLVAVWARTSEPLDRMG